ncbi:pilus assembly protein [Halioxenophilus aromaticivorans]|uniref:PilC/PilY family type IV pilus protein n=1 Tax=Halioxenophilus aromaticivorans TaxID=1306992 RepID=A0AAV3TYD5_9ALTE
MARINTSYKNQPQQRANFKFAALGFSVLTAAGGSNALELPDQPILSSAGTEPNIMLFMDNSGSMATFELGYYDASYSYADCPASLALETSRFTPGRDPDNGVYQDIVARVDSDGLAYFTYTKSIGGRNGGTETYDFQWGTSTTGGERYPVACFASGASYDLSPVVGVTNYQTFDGNQLNYYFSNATQTGPDYWAGDRKAGSGTRMDITKMAGETLINSLTNKRIGLAAFEQVPVGQETPENGGAKILVGIDDIDTEVKTGYTQREAIIDQIYSMMAEGFTPIGESLSDITRYYVTGHDNERVTLYNNDASRTNTALTKQVFDTKPAYATGVAKPGSDDDSIITESCQKNYVIALTDGEPNETGLVSSYLTGRNGSGNGPFTGYDKKDSNYAEYGYTARNNLIRRDVGSLDDVTMAMYDIDLRPDLSGNEPINISTFFVGGFDTSLQDSKVLARAASNGVGGAPEGIVYPALNQEELEEAFRTIFALVDSDSGSRSTVSFNAGSIDSSTALYQATYDFAGTQWVGDVEAFAYNKSGTGSLFSTTAAWSANDKLTARVKDVLPGADDRDIITLSGFSDSNGTSVRKGIAFTADNASSFSAELQGDLDGDGSNSDTLGKVVNYVRGAEFPGEYRNRVDGGLGILGDIINSSPAEIGAPESDYPDYSAKAALPFGDANSSYSAFYKSNENRASVVYVGANDGMLHAFDGDVSTGGKELFAYVPSMLADSSSEIEGLFYLTDQNYQHRFYVDGAIGVSDVFIDPAGGTNKSWRTVLMGALGLGGKGLYALDVTDPSSFSESSAEDIVLWEFDGRDSSPATGDPDMGHIFSEPKITMMNDGRFAVVVGNGANSTNGSAVLFIIFIEAGADGSWDVDDWIKIDTGSTGNNGLSAPALVDFDGDRVVDRIYAGDLNGQLWGFDVSSTDSSEWKAAHGSTPLFTATNSSGVAQAITSAPLVVKNEQTAYAGNEPNVLVLFGTGQLIEEADIGSAEEQTFYGIWDRGVGGLDRSALLQRKLVNASNANGVVIGRKIDDQSPYSDPIAWFDDANQDQYGWYMPLPDTGERVTIQPSLLLGTIFFFSSVPQESTCSAGGYGYLNFISAQGTATRTPIYDFNNDGVIDADDSDFVSQKTPGRKGLPAGSKFIGSGEAQNVPCSSGSGFYQAYSTIDGAIHYRWVCPESSTGTGRMAWQELFGE